MTTKKKWWIAGIACLIACLSISIFFFIRESRLNAIRDEALEILERDIGLYDDQSIVLQNTSRVKAEALAKRFGATLRITSNGRFATLTLPEGVTIRDIYARKDARKYIEDMSADYQVRISNLTGEEENVQERLPVRPNYTVSDADYGLQGYLDYLNIKNVWNKYTGKSVTVAIIDTGIDTDHPEFVGRISEYSYNATEDKVVKDWVLDGGGYDWSLIEDEQGHKAFAEGIRHALEA